MLEGNAQMLEHTICQASGGDLLVPAAPIHSPAIIISLPASSPQYKQARTQNFPPLAEGIARNWGGLGRDILPLFQWGGLDL